MHFKIYKRGQGYYTRLGTGLSLFAIVAIGSYILHGKLTVYGKLLLETLLPAGICVVFGLLIFWLVNKPSVADFMIASEGEIKKVNWSSRREIFVSTVIVICVVAIMSTLLYVADILLTVLFMYGFKIYSA